MRRTRYVALPVRAWRYVGLLVVSLACLTVGLVSRDKEGRAGSLAGPELEHRAPHDVDACPNFGPFTETPACSNHEQDQTGISKTTRETRWMSRSRSAERVSRVRLEYRTDFRSTDRSDKQRRSVRNDFSRRTLESNFGTRGQDRARRATDPEIQLSPSLGSRFTDDLASRRTTGRSTDSDRHRGSSRRINEYRGRETVARSTERRTSTDTRRERTGDGSVRTRTMIVRDTRLGRDRRSLSRTDRRDLANERRERANRSIRRTSEPRDSSFETLKRERTDRFYLTREQREKREKRENRAVGAFETSRNELKQRRVRDLSDDRRSERRVSADSRRTSERRSTTVESRNREEVRAHRALAERRADRRLAERRTDRRRMDQRVNRRSMEQRVDERVDGQRDNRREQRFERRLANRGEIGSDRRLTEHRGDRRHVEQRSDRRLMERRIERRVTEHRNDRRESTRVYDQRTRTALALPANDVRSNAKEKTNSLSRSRSIHRDLPENVRLSRVPNQQRDSRITADKRSVGVRDNVLSRSSNFVPRTKTLSIMDPLKGENTMNQAATFEVIRHALVIGLCTLYGLTMFHGKRSFLSNFATQLPLFIVW